MKQLLSCLITGLALLAISGCSAPLHSQTSFNKLVWSDEFNYQGLPDSSKWGYDRGTGCPDVCGNTIPGTGKKMPGWKMVNW